jgi:hypothetical protein
MSITDTEIQKIHDHMKAQIAMVCKIAHARGVRGKIDLEILGDGTCLGEVLFVNQTGLVVNKFGIMTEAIPKPEPKKK